MANRRLAPAAVQPASFAFTSENAAWAQGQIEKYPEGRQASAVISLLWRAQEQNGGWLPQKAIEAVAATLGMPQIRVLEVATFYTMFALEPVGRFWIQLCGTVPCDVCGAKGLKAALQTRIGPPGHVTPDGNFSWIEVECLGACCNAPMVQINQDYYEDLTPDSLNKLLDDLAAGRPVKIGPQNGRRASEPQEAIGTLNDATLFDGSRVGAWRARFAETHVDGAGVAKQDAPSAVETKKEETVTTEQRVAKQPKPAVPSSGRATETDKVETPATHSADDRASDKDAAQSSQAPAAAATSTETADKSAADARAVAEDQTLRSEPPRQPEGSGEEISGVSGASEAGASPEKDRIRGVGHSELIAAHRHFAERKAAESGGDGDSRPAGLTEPRDGKPDDLTRIAGIEPVFVAGLSALGIFHFAQIAAWTPVEIAWIGDKLSIPGRIEGGDWVGQARALAEKGEV